MNIKYKLASLFLLLVFALHANAQLVPDSTYSQDGYFITPNTGYDRVAPRIFELPDGSILAAGVNMNPTMRFTLWKFTPTGQPDTQFGNNGEASNVQLDSELGYIYNIRDIDTLADGKIVVLAEQIIRGANLDLDQYAIALIRFNADGSTDNTFNTKGYLLDKPKNNYEYVPGAMAIDKVDGKGDIYVGCLAVHTGNATCPAGFAQWSISKYTQNGSKDLSFNNNTGYIQEDASVIMQGNTAAAMAIIHDMRVMDNGKLIAAGAFFTVDSAYFSFKLSNTGQWDNTFGNNGRCVHHVHFPVPSNDFSNAKVLSDGSSMFYSILTYYNQPSLDSSELFCVKNTPLGIPSTSFGINGVLNFSYYSQQYPVFIPKSDQSFLFAYYRPYGAQFADQKIEFMSFNANGVKDLSFGTNGLLKTSPRSPDTYVNKSNIFDGIWTKNETGIYLTCSNQIPSSRIQIGIFKYKWPGLTPLQINDYTNPSFVEIYPVPSNQTLNIQVPHEYDNGLVTIFDMQGKFISTHQLSNQFIRINTSRYADGLYFVKYTSKQFTKTQKVVIKH